MTTLIPLSRALDIPFNRLVLSQANVRQINAGISIDELSEDIALRGLLQGLNVRPIVDTEGTETGKYEVPAGGRRFRALEKLVKAKRLPKTAPIPCVIRGAGVDTTLEDDSLAENTRRVALHPLDQYRAFLALRRQNLSEEDIAARYFVSVTVVKQRLKLAAVSPVLLDLYAAEELTLEQLMAFTVTGDHARQEALWKQLKTMASHMREAYHIRRHLTEGAISATDHRAQFIGTEAYEAAGGVILRDLFSGDNGGWLQDGVLLDRLVLEKLTSIAETIKGEGWKWVEVLPSLPFDHLYGLRQLTAIQPDLAEDDQAALTPLKEELELLSETYAEFEDLPEEVEARMAEIETAIEALQANAIEAFDPAEIVRAGVVVSVGRNGDAQILRGYVRPADEAQPVDDSGEPGAVPGEGEAPVSDAHSTTVITLGAAAPPKPIGTDDEVEDEALRPLPEKLILELTAFRTVALRDAIARNPRVAMTLLLHKLVADTFQHRCDGNCLQAWVSAPQMVSIAPKGLNETIAAESMARRRELWTEIIPADDQALWDWLDGESDEVRMELLAFCVSYGVNAIKERTNPYGGGPSAYGITCRLNQADRLAVATDLDLVADGWRPTAETYLNRVPRIRILEAVREGCGERSAQMIDHLKKADMVIEAERLLADAGWLPEVLRGPEAVVPDTGEGAALPAFLTGPVEGDDPSEDLPPVAAE